MRLAIPIFLLLGMKDASFLDYGAHELMMNRIF